MGENARQASQPPDQVTAEDGAVARVRMEAMSSSPSESAAPRLDDAPVVRSGAGLWPLTGYFLGLGTWGFRRPVALAGDLEGGRGRADHERRRPGRGPRPACCQGQGQVVASYRRREYPESAPGIFSRQHRTVAQGDRASGGGCHAGQGRRVEDRLGHADVLIWTSPAHARCGKQTLRSGR
jgi:hypothetical protein